MALGLKREVVRNALAELADQGRIACCTVTDYASGKAVDEILCRASGYIPPAAPGRKPKR